MPARAESARPALIVERRDLRIFVHEPFGRSRGRRAEHNFQPDVAERVDRLVEPIPMKLALPRLVAGPCEFTEADVCNAEFAHPPRVLGPPGFAPMFRVVANAEHQRSFAPLKALSRPHFLLVNRASPPLAR